MSSRQLMVLATVAILLSTVLCLSRLNTPSFWDDESFVAITARNLLRFGKFTVWDGRNLFTSNNGGANLKAHIPPFDTILTAASFKLLGQSNATARLPFALCGVLTLLAFIQLVNRRLPGQRVVLAYALVLLGLSVQFCLLNRNCRYYAPAVLFATLAYLSYQWFISTRRLVAAGALLVASLLLHYAHPLSAAAMLGAIAVVHFSFYARRLGWKQHWPLVAAGLAFLLVTVPLALREHLLEFTYDQSSASDSPVLRKLTLVWWNLRDLNLICALPWTMLAALGVFLWNSRAQSAWRSVRAAGLEWLVVVLSYTALIGLLSPQLPSVTSIADVRYLFPVIPFAAAAIACMLVWLDARSRPAAVVLTLLLVCTNVLSFLPTAVAPGAARVRWLLPGLIGELLNPYPTPTDEVRNFLAANVKQDQVVAPLPDFFGFPLIYYLGDRIKVGCLLNEHTTIPREALQQFDAPLFMEETFPDWIVCYGPSPNPARVVGYFSRPHDEHGRQVIRQYHLGTLIDVFPVQTQRPELPWHEFTKPPADARHGAGIYIFEGGPNRPFEAKAASSIER